MEVKEGVKRTLSIVCLDDTYRDPENPEMFIKKVGTLDPKKKYLFVSPLQKQMDIAESLKFRIQLED